MSGIGPRLLPAVVAPGLALLGWCSVAPPGAFLDELARPALLLALVAGRVGMADAYRFRIQARSEARAQVLLPLLVLASTAAALVGCAALDGRPSLAPGLHLDAPGWRWLGVGLFAAGIALQAWAARTLGRWFSPRIAIQPGHELVQAGPYAWLRHPFYSGLLLCIPALPLAFGCWLGLPAVLLVLPALAWRVRSEERLLAAEFGPAFVAYAARTWRLVPFLF